MKYGYIQHALLEHIYSLYGLLYNYDNKYIKSNIYDTFLHMIHVRLLDISYVLDMIHLWQQVIDVSYTCTRYDTLRTQLNIT